MSFLKRTTLANVVSAFCIIISLLYFVYVKNTDGVVFLVGSAVGYLYGRRTQEASR